MKTLFERLELRNFEGYKHAEIDFAKGLNIITGRNSTGKTTLLEALLFTLYGGAPGVEKKLLVSKLQGASGVMSVRLTANMTGKRVEILREGKLIGKESEAKRFRTEKLALKVDGRDIPVYNEEELNKKISELAGMGVKMFTTLAYARQGELTNILEPRKEDMDLLLGISLMKELVEQLDSAKKTLERYEGKEVKTAIEMYRQQLPDLIQQIDQLNGLVNSLSRETQDLEEMIGKAKSKEMEQLLQLITRRDELTTQIRENELSKSNILTEKGLASTEELERLKEDYTKKVEDLKAEIQQLKTEEERIKSVWQDTNSKLTQVKANMENAGVSSIQELDEKIASMQNRHDQLNRELEDVEPKFNNIEQRRNTLDGKLSTLKEEIMSHENLLEKGLANCPTCGQEVNSDILAQIIDDKKATVANLSKDLDEVNSQYKELKTKINELKNSLSQLDTSLENLQQIHEKLTALLEGVTKEQLEQKLSEAKKDLDGISITINEQTQKLAKLESEKEAIYSAINKLKNFEEDKNRLEKELKQCLGNIKTNLQALAFPFKPEDVELKSKIAEQLPLSLDELKKKEKELNDKKERLGRLKADVEGLQKKEETIKIKVGELEKRLGRVKVCEQLLDKLKGGIEGQRERRLKRIADEALRAYETLTDQRVYKAFRINKDDYTVEVFPTRLDGYIPAKRTGGGHQTLIALAVRIALLNVLNQRSLMILDEPTYGVDSENLPQLMSYFSEAAKKIDQTILVTHYGLGEEEAANIVKVSITEDGSSTISHA
jgi:exonuclease SbcC